MNFNFLGNILCSEIFYHDPRIYVDQTDEGNYEINQHFQSQINSEVNMIIKTAIHNYAEFFNVNKRNVSVFDIAESKLNIEQWTSNNFNQIALTKYGDVRKIESYYIKNIL